MKLTFILLSLLSYPAFAESSIWDLYREIMEREEQGQGKIEEIPQWMYRETQRQVRDELNDNKRDSFRSFLERHKGDGAVASLGNDGPNGGDSYGSEFVSIGYQIYEALLKSNTEGLDLDAFSKSLDEVIVYSDEGSYIAVRGQPVDALNFPKDKKILISRSRWRQMLLKQKIALVFHEYLGVLGVERNVYRTSKLMNKFFDDLVLKLKEKQVQYYYGLCEANLPLLYRGEVCSSDHPHVEAAILCAKEKALKRCLLESYTDCEGQIVLREGRIQEFGLQTCRVTSIIK